MAKRKAAPDIDAAIAHVFPGDRVKFAENKIAWTVRSRSARYLILTRPFNPHNSVVYTIVDLKTMKRGPDDNGLRFVNRYKSDTDCAERLDELESGFIEMSIIDRIPVNVQEIHMFGGGGK